MNNEFNIFNFGRKTVSKILFVGSDGNIMPFEAQLAVLSHYLQLKGTKYEITYKKMALKIIDHWSKLLKD